MADPKLDAADTAALLYPEIIAKVRAAFRGTPLVGVALAVAELRGPYLHWGGADEWGRDDSRLMAALREAQAALAVPFALAFVAKFIPPLEEEFHRESRDGLTVAVHWVFHDMRGILPADAEAKAVALSRDFLASCLRWRRPLVPGPGVLQ
jgi:hypothetical protein